VIVKRLIEVLPDVFFFLPVDEKKSALYNSVSFAFTLLNTDRVLTVLHVNFFDNKYV